MTVQIIDGHRYLVSSDGTCMVAADPVTPPVPDPAVVAAQTLATAIITGSATPLQVNTAIGHILRFLAK